jgi:hypothetical protein
MVLDLETGKQVGTLSTRSGKIDGLWLSANGKVLVTREEQTTRLGTRRALVLWDPATGKRVDTLGSEFGGLGVFSEVSVSEDGNTLAALFLGVMRDAQPRPGERPAAAWAVVWDLTTRKIRHRIPLPVPENPGQIRRDNPVGPALVLSADGKVIAANTGSGYKFWDAATGKETADFGNSSKHFVRLDYDDGKDEYLVERLELGAGRAGPRLRVSHPPGQNPRVLASTHDARMAVVTGEGPDGIEVLDLVNGKTNSILRLEDDILIAAAFSSYGKTLAGVVNTRGEVHARGRGELHIKVWDLPEMAGKEK